jgi:hypothetical protein
VGFNAESGSNIVCTFFKVYFLENLRVQGRLGLRSSKNADKHFSDFESDAQQEYISG